MELKCGIQCAAPQQTVWKFKATLLRRNPAWTTHPSDLRSRLAARLRIGCGYGRPLSRRVCAPDAQCGREKRHVRCVPRNLMLTDPSVTPWWSPVSRSLRCVVCTSETAFFCASMVARCFLYYIFPPPLFSNFTVLFPHFRVFTDSQALDGQRDYNLAGAPSTLIGMHDLSWYSTSCEGNLFDNRLCNSSTDGVYLSCPVKNAQGCGRETSKKPNVSC